MHCDLIIGSALGFGVARGTGLWWVGLLVAAFTAALLFFVSGDSLTRERRDSP